MRVLAQPPICPTIAEAGHRRHRQASEISEVVDGQGLPLGSQFIPASPAEVTLAEGGMDLICSHRSNLTRLKTQDGRKLRRYHRRWIIECAFARLGDCRRLVVRCEGALLPYRALSISPAVSS